MNKESPNKSPKTITQEQKHLDELTGTFINAAKAKGWWSQVTAKDNKNFRYATIEVRRSDVKVHPNCRHLTCFVYDPHSNLKNPAGLEADLSKKHDALNVKVIVVSPS